MDAAQQRPRYHPRLHKPAGNDPFPMPIRSTKAEVSPPATPPKNILGTSRHCLRSTKAEVSPPATHARTPAPAGEHAALNKGRGITPGYTSAPALAPDVGIVRSTKAEVSPPATRAILPGCAGGAERSTKAEVSPPATLLARGIGSVNMSTRSTKAEVSPPATHSDQPVNDGGIPAPLNKGRGITPGYTRPFPPRSGIAPDAQQRPRYHPRLHLRVCADLRIFDIRSTKAEVSPPATPVLASWAVRIMSAAQQRPRYHPRLHLKLNKTHISAL